METETETENKTLEGDASGTVLLAVYVFMLGLDSRCGASFLVGEERVFAGALSVSTWGNQ